MTTARPTWFANSSVWMEAEDNNFRLWKSVCSERRISLHFSWYSLLLNKGKEYKGLRARLILDQSTIYIPRERERSFSPLSDILSYLKTSSLKTNNGGMEHWTNVKRCWFVGDISMQKVFLKGMNKLFEHSYYKYQVRDNTLDNYRKMHMKQEERNTKIQTRKRKQSSHHKLVQLFWSKKECIYNNYKIYICSIKMCKTWRVY